MEISINTVPAVIGTNFEAIERQLDEQLEKYRGLVVADDGVSDARAMATELNKLKGEIATRRKDEARKASEPVKAFEAHAKSLEKKIEDVRSGLTSQIEKYQEQRLEKIRAALIERLQRLYQEQGVHEEFQEATISGLDKLDVLTKTGKLTAGTRQSLEGRVAACLAKQNKIETRLARLEVYSFRAGLKSPLTKDNVIGFLYTDDDEHYDQNLDRVVQGELRRQTETILAAAQENAQEREEVADPAPEQVEEPTPEAAPEEPQGAPTGNAVRFDATVMLSVDLPPGTSQEQFERSLRSRLAKAGIEKSITGVYISLAESEDAA